MTRLEILIIRKRSKNLKIIYYRKRIVKTEEEDLLYDPYDVLVQLQQKKNMINKIKSIPILHDRFAATRGKSGNYIIQSCGLISLLINYYS